MCFLAFCFWHGNCYGVCMNTETEITMWANGGGGCRWGKLPFVEMKEVADMGGRVTLLIRHAERPPLDPTDKTYGARLPITARGWSTARELGWMLAHAVRPRSVAFHASSTLRTVETAYAMANGMGEPGSGCIVEKEVRISEFLGGDSPFFGSAEERWALIGEGHYHDRVNEYFRCGHMRGYRPLKGAMEEMESLLAGLHGGEGGLTVAVTHDINVAAFLAGGGVVPSFTDETWPGFLDAAVILRHPDGHSEHGVLRWQDAMLQPGSEEDVFYAGLPQRKIA